MASVGEYYNYIDFHINVYYIIYNYNHLYNNDDAKIYLRGYYMEPVLEKHLLKCVDCGTDFFTEGENEFYISKGLSIPKRCKACREKRKMASFRKPGKTGLSDAALIMYEEILNNWSVEARKEPKKYFYYIQEVNEIREGKKSFVIGRKGSGKTAIAQYLHEAVGPNTFSTKLSFKNFPFNILYALENNSEYAAPNQYISMWKYLIYSCLCRKMIENQAIDGNVREKLSKLYGNSSMDALNKLIGKWTSKAFGLEVLGSGFSYERERVKKDCTWIDILDILQQLTLDFCDSSKYFFLFDELDEDYKEFETKAEERKYMCMLTSLFKAVQDIKSSFAAAGKKIYPVVFLRSDIYAQIKDSDKNKWREMSIDLEWNTTKIKNMVAHRLCVAQKDSAEKDFVTAWNSIFSSAYVSMGHQQQRRMDIFSYIERSTEMRPRDFVQYIKECVSIAKEKSEYPISPKTVRSADDNFSEYLKGETIDELFPVLPEIDEVLGLLSTIRKQSFNFSTFESEYNSLVERGVIPKRDIREVLLLLFDAGVIGNQPSMKGQTIFRFSKNKPRFNFNETMIIHRGLYKALQIF